MPYLSSGLSNLHIFLKYRLTFFLLPILILTLFYSTKDIKADYIYLKNGSIISGILVEEKEKLIVYRVAYGEIFINRENITKIIHENKDRPLLREAERYFKEEKFKRAIKTCGEVLEIDPNNVEALELKQKAVTAWQNYVTEKEEKGRREKEKQEQMARELENLKTALKAKKGISIGKEKDNYIISDVYYNCPLNKGEIKPGDILVAVHGTEITNLPIKKVSDLLLTLKKINLTVQRPVVLTREEILWRGTKKYVGLGISIEKIDKGIKITDVMPNGPAVKAGVLKDDVIIALKGSAISSSSMDSIINILKGSAGTKLQATIEREVTLD